MGPLRGTYVYVKDMGSISSGGRDVRHGSRGEGRTSASSEHGNEHGFFSSCSEAGTSSSSMNKSYLVRGYLIGK